MSCKVFIDTLNGAGIHTISGRGGTIKGEDGKSAGCKSKKKSKTRKVHDNGKSMNHYDLFDLYLNYHCHLDFDSLLINWPQIEDNNEKKEKYRN